MAYGHESPTIFISGCRCCRIEGSSTHQKAVQCQDGPGALLFVLRRLDCVMKADTELFWGAGGVGNPHAGWVGFNWPVTLAADNGRGSGRATRGGDRFSPVAFRTRFHLPRAEDDTTLARRLLAG
jgi:hypothetical protein